MKPLVRVIGKREQRFYACTAAREDAWHSCLTRAVSAPAVERAVAEVLLDAGSGLERVRALLRPPSGTSSDAAQELERRVYRVLSVFRGSWGLLDRRERPRALRALLAEVDYDARDGTLGVALKASGLDWLTGEGALLGGAEPPERRLAPPRGAPRLEGRVDTALMRGPSSRRSWVKPLYMTAAERLALAHTIEGLVRDGRAPNYTEAAQQRNYSPSRIISLMVQLFLAPAIQHEILSLGDEELRSVRESDLRKIDLELDWNRQWERWAAVRGKDHPYPSSETNDERGAGPSCAAALPQARQRSMRRLAELEERRHRLLEELLHLRKLAQQSPETSVLPCGGQGPAVVLQEAVEERVAAAERARSIRAELVSSHRAWIEERSLAQALWVFDPGWEALAPQEQWHALNLLVERVLYDPRTGKVSVLYREPVSRFLGELAGVLEAAQDSER